MGKDQRFTKTGLVIWTTPLFSRDLYVSEMTKGIQIWGYHWERCHSFGHMGDNERSRKDMNELVPVLVPSESEVTIIELLSTQKADRVVLRS